MRSGLVKLRLGLILLALCASAAATQPNYFFGASTTPTPFNYGTWTNNLGVTLRVYALVSGTSSSASDVNAVVSACVVPGYEWNMTPCIASHIHTGEAVLVEYEGQFGTTVGSTLTFAGTHTPFDGQTLTVVAQNTNAAPFAFLMSTSLQASYIRPYNNFGTLVDHRGVDGLIYAFTGDSFSNVGAPGNLTFRVSADNGVSFGPLTTLVTDTTNVCDNQGSTQCTYTIAETGMTASGRLLVWTTKIDFSLDTINKWTWCDNACTNPASWAPLQTWSRPDLECDMCWDVVYGHVFTLPSGQLAMSQYAFHGNLQGYRHYLITSCDNGASWGQPTCPNSVIVVAENAATNESFFQTLAGTNTVLMFERNLVSSSTPLAPCKGFNGPSPTACGPMIMSWSLDGGLTWSPYVNTNIVDYAGRQPLGFEEVSPWVVPGQGGQYTLLYVDRTGPYLSAINFYPNRVIANPQSFPPPQIVSAYPASGDSGYPSAINLTNDTLLIQWAHQQYASGPTNQFLMTAQYALRPACSCISILRNTSSRSNRTGGSGSLRLIQLRLHPPDEIDQGRRLSR